MSEFFLDHSSVRKMKFLFRVTLLVTFLPFYRWSHWPTFIGYRITSMILVWNKGKAEHSVNCMTGNNNEPWSLFVCTDSWVVYQGISLWTAQWQVGQGCIHLEFSLETIYVSTNVGIATWVWEVCIQVKDLWPRDTGVVDTWLKSLP